MLEDAGQFPLRRVDLGQIDDRSGEHPVVIVEGPVFGDPLVQGVDDRERQLRVVCTGVFDETAEGRVDQRLDDTLAVEFGDPVLGVACGCGCLDRLALHLAECLTLGVLACEELLVRARGGDPFEGRVRDEVGDLVVDDDPGLRAELGVLHRACVTVGQVLRQRVGRLVHVLIGVEDWRVTELVHRVIPFLREQSQKPLSVGVSGAFASARAASAGHDRRTGRARCAVELGEAHPRFAGDLPVARFAA